MRTTTLSATPRASITVSRAKPGPSGVKNSVRWAVGTRLRHAVDQKRERLHPAGNLQRHLGQRTPLGALEPGAVRREHDARRAVGLVARERARPEALQRRRQASVGRPTSAPFGAFGSAVPTPSEARKGIEQDRRAPRRGPTSPGTGAPSGRPTQTPTVRLPSKPDGPGVTVAVAGAGLERDAPDDAVFRRRRADQHVADVPGRDRIDQAARRVAALSASRRSISGTVVPPRASPA